MMMMVMMTIMMMMMMTTMTMMMVIQASRLCTVRQARIQLATVLTFAVVYNAPKFAEARIELVVDPMDNSTWLHPDHTALGVSRLYNVVYCNVLYTLFTTCSTRCSCCYCRSFSLLASMFASSAK